VPSGDPFSQVRENTADNRSPYFAPASQPTKTATRGHWLELALVLIQFTRTLQKTVAEFARIRENREA